MLDTQTQMEPKPSTTRVPDSPAPMPGLVSAVVPPPAAAAPAAAPPTLAAIRPGTPRNAEAPVRPDVQRSTDVHGELASEKHVISVDKFNLFYGKHQALHQIGMNIPVGKVTALIGPSGCGKSTLLRSFNRLNDLLDNVRTEGTIRFRGEPIHDHGVDVIRLRKQMGMVFQKSNPFPMSIFDNVVYALRIAGEKRRNVLNEVCEKSLRGAALWDEVKDRLHQSALGMSGGQQQRLCIARAIAAEPDVLLMDEPCSALDPIATAKIEDLIYQLRGRYSVVIVTHNMQQAARCSDYTAFMYLGRLIEYGPTNSIFLNPHLKETEAYVTGRFG